MVDYSKYYVIKNTLKKQYYVQINPDGSFLGVDDADMAFKMNCRNIAYDLCDRLRDRLNDGSTFVIEEYDLKCNI